MGQTPVTNTTDFYRKPVVTVPGGERVERKIICKNCHHANKIGANFCSRCGEKLRDGCKCWVLKKDNCSCKERSCPGYKLLTKLRK